MLTLQLKTTCYGVFLPTMKTMMINNINNTNAWCQLVYKSLKKCQTVFSHLESGNEVVTEQLRDLQWQT